jgi:hypothetical protein
MIGAKNRYQPPGAVRETTNPGRRLSVMGSNAQCDSNS